MDFRDCFCSIFITALFFDINSVSFSAVLVIIDINFSVAPYGMVEILSCILIAIIYMVLIKFSYKF
ncbi:hypothetical protein [Campylobacter pinnipediorum]|uniref:hypothetical protein n=1 Tax=Campylobacter pinnipediorum TaxID=1965231 RepID=UPI000995754F|nr:hypothetical protein [Campylobacter pinnipediorum]